MVETRNYIVTEDFCVDGLLFLRGCVLKVLPIYDTTSIIYDYFVYIETVNKVNFTIPYEKLHNEFIEEYKNHYKKKKHNFKLYRSWCVSSLDIHANCVLIEDIPNYI